MGCSGMVFMMGWGGNAVGGFGLRPKKELVILVAVTISESSIPLIKYSH